MPAGILPDEPRQGAAVPVLSLAGSADLGLKPVTNLERNGRVDHGQAEFSDVEPATHAQLSPEQPTTQ